MSTREAFVEKADILNYYYKDEHVINSGKYVEGDLVDGTIFVNTQPVISFMGVIERFRRDPGENGRWWIEFRGSRPIPLNLARTKITIRKLGSAPTASSTGKRRLTRAPLF